MNDLNEIEKLADEYATNKNDCYANDYQGFVDGFVSCRDKIAEAIRTTPNDKDLGAKLRSLFIEKDLL